MQDFSRFSFSLSLLDEMLLGFSHILFIGYP